MFMTNKDDILKSKQRMLKTIRNISNPHVFMLTRTNSDLVEISKRIGKHYELAYGPELVSWSFKDFCERNNVDVSKQSEYENALDYYAAYNWHMNCYDHAMYEEVDFYEASQETFSRYVGSCVDFKSFKRDARKLFKNATVVTAKNDEFPRNSLPITLSINTSSFNLEEQYNLNALMDWYGLSLEDANEDSTNKIFTLGANRFFKSLPGSNQYNYEDAKYVLSDASSLVHSQDFIYFAAFKSEVDNILKFGLHPSYFDCRRMRYFIDEPFIKWLMHSYMDWQKFLRKWIKRYDKFDYATVILKIDVSKLNKHMKFFKDAVGAIYGVEPILPTAITM